MDPSEAIDRIERCERSDRIDRCEEREPIACCGRECGVRAISRSITCGGS
jgi:hypothetical protein